MSKYDVIGSFWERPYDEELAFRHNRVAELTMRLNVSRSFLDVAPLLAGLTPSNAASNLGSVKIILSARRTTLEALALSLRQYLLPYETIQRVEREALEFLAGLGRAQKASDRKEGALALKTILEVKGYSIRQLIDFLSGVNDAALAGLEHDLHRAQIALEDMRPKEEQGEE